MSIIIYVSILFEALLVGIVIILIYFIIMNVRKSEKVKVLKAILSLGTIVSQKEMMTKENSFVEGITVCDGYIFPVRFAVDDYGVTLTVLTLIRNKSLNIEWSLISSITKEKLKLHDSIDEYAEIRLIGCDLKFYVPWDAEFDQFIPDTFNRTETQ
ncbi:hypothetical protein SVI_3789 [Shewanella violacea DSS12]|uniref:Uncharacterized protein n=2 Tax=Shewanella violacea TaxID=60217 RepID=D4ZCL5_SHEVD|nr:hypothetical protein SVI_3789 [Shewanella violacea DSS12]